MERKGLGKTIRFEVFKRDNFTCVYCGNTPPKVTLEIDHMIPVSKGGKSTMINLVTSCFDCNRGKRDRLLSSTPKNVTDTYDIIIEKQKQYEMYQKQLKKIRIKSEAEINEISDLYSKETGGYYLKESFKSSSVKSFIDKLGFEDVMDSMVKSINKIIDGKNRCTGWDAENIVKYFCGICWNKIKSR